MSDVAAVKENKRQLEREIRALLNTFQHQHGVHVARVDLTNNQAFGDEANFIAAVTIEVTL